MSQYNHNARLLYKVSRPSDSNNSALVSNHRVYPTPKYAYTSVKSHGEITLNGHHWANTTTGQCKGDPTAAPGSDDEMRLWVNTSQNHHCNFFWGSFTQNYVTERNVRGIYLVHWNGGSNGNPQMKGVALVHVNSSGNKIYTPLGLGGEDWTHSHYNTVNSTTTSQKKYWGVSKTGTASIDAYHNKGYKWAGVLFNYQTTKKATSARDQPIYIANLRPICDDGRGSTPTYSGKWRVWGTDFK